MAFKLFAKRYKTKVLIVVLGCFLFNLCLLFPYTDTEKANLKFLDQSTLFILVFIFFMQSVLNYLLLKKEIATFGVDSKKVAYSQNSKNLLFNRIVIISYINLIYSVTSFLFVIFLEGFDPRLFNNVFFVSTLFLLLNILYLLGIKTSNIYNILFQIVVISAGLFLYAFFNNIDLLLLASILYIGVSGMLVWHIKHNQHNEEVKSQKNNH